MLLIRPSRPATVLAAGEHVPGAVLAGAVLAEADGEPGGGVGAVGEFEDGRVGVREQPGGVGFAQVGQDTGAEDGAGAFHRGAQHVGHRDDAAAGRRHAAGRLVEEGAVAEHEGEVGGHRADEGRRDGLAGVGRGGPGRHQGQQP